MDRGPELFALLRIRQSPGYLKTGALSSPPYKQYQIPLLAFAKLPLKRFAPPSLSLANLIPSYLLTFMSFIAIYVSY